MGSTHPEGDFPQEGVGALARIPGCEGHFVRKRRRYRVGKPSSQASVSGTPRLRENDPGRVCFSLRGEVRRGAREE